MTKRRVDRRAVSLMFLRGVVGEGRTRRPPKNTGDDSWLFEIRIGTLLWSTRATHTPSCPGLTRASMMTLNE